MDKNKYHLLSLSVTWFYYLVNFTFLWFQNISFKQRMVYFGLIWCPLFYNVVEPANSAVTFNRPFFVEQFSVKAIENSINSYQIITSPKKPHSFIFDQRILFLYFQSSVKVAGIQLIRVVSPLNIWVIRVPWRLIMVSTAPSIYLTTYLFYFIWIVW